MIWRADRFKADIVQSKPSIFKLRLSSKPKKTTLLRHKWHFTLRFKDLKSVLPAAGGRCPQRQQDCGVLTVGGDPVGLPWGRIGSVGSSLLDSCAVLSLSIGCHAGEGRDCHYVGVMSVQNKKTEGFKAIVTVHDLLEHKQNSPRHLAKITFKTGCWIFWELGIDWTEAEVCFMNYQTKPPKCVVTLRHCKIYAS